MTIHISLDRFLGG